MDRKYDLLLYTLTIIIVSIFLIICVFPLQFPSIIELYHEDPTIQPYLTQYAGDTRNSSPILYNNTLYDFSIEYPGNWGLIENYNFEDYTAIVVFIGPYIDKWNSNVAIKTIPAQDYSLHQYIQLTKQTNLDSLSSNDYIMIGEGTLKINGQNAYFLDYAFSSDGDPVRVKQYLILNNDNIYTISYYALQNAYEYNINDFNTMVLTFKFLGRAPSSTRTESTPSWVHYNG